MYGLNHLEKIDTSFHEAGHVVIGLLHNIKVQYCIVHPDFSGWTEGINIEPNDNFNSNINNELINSWIYFNYGGLITDRHRFTLQTGSKKYPKIIKSGSSLDIKEVSNSIIRHNLAAPGKERGAFKQKMQRRVAKMVKEYWSDIILISHAIYNKKNSKLYYDDIKITLIKNSDNKSFWKEKFKQIDRLHSLCVEEIISSDLKDLI